MKNTLRPALVLFVLVTLITGLAYPLAVTGLAQIFFPQQAHGDVRLIGQPFTDPRHFWGRPSATADKPYNALASGGANQGPLNPALTEQKSTGAVAQVCNDSSSMNSENDLHVTCSIYSIQISI